MLEMRMFIIPCINVLLLFFSRVVAVCAYVRVCVRMRNLEQRLVVLSVPVVLAIMRLRI